MPAKHNHPPFYTWPQQRIVAVPLLAGAIVLACFPAKCRGEDHARELPKDGTWVRYQMEAESDGKKDTSATVTLSFVGSVIEDGKPCRWVEKRTVIPEPDTRAGAYVSKFLVSEQDLLGSEKPLEHARRTWIRRLNAPAVQQQIDSWALSEQCLLWTPEMVKGSTFSKDVSKDIEYQRGKLKNAGGRTGELIYKRPGPSKREVRLVRKCTVWQHPDLPFGCAEARIVNDRFLGDAPMGKFSSAYFIQDFGSDAKSELPDNN